MCQRARCVAVRLEKSDELVVGNASCLREAIHAPPNFDVDVSVMEQGAQHVLLNDGIREHPNWHTHVFVPGHWSAEVEIL